VIKYKSKWWMPRHKKTMKDVVACEKSRGGGKQPLIRESPNGVTLPSEARKSMTEYIGHAKTTQRSETSQ